MSDAPLPLAHILLVEDAPDQAYVLKVQLERLGAYRVSVAQDGLRALERVEVEPVDLVITDLNLPGMDGFELVATLKRRHPALPVLVVTGYEIPAHLEGARRAGADGVMVKPVEPQALGTRLDEILAGGAADAVAPADDHRRGVVALAHRPGDLEMGCGGTLLAHAAAGESVQVLVLTGPGQPAEAAARLGGEALPAHAGDARGALRHLAAWTRARAPRVAYLPSPRDDDATRAALFEAARDALTGIPRVLGYATATSSLDFRPELFLDVTPHRAPRREALQALVDAGVPGLPDPDFLDAHALYWGRFAGFRPVEPFEILRDGTP